MSIVASYDEITTFHRSNWNDSTPCMIVFIAFGTRGDVQPLACLASHVKNKSADQVAFITHLDHRTWIEEPPFECLGPVYIDSPSSGPEAQTRSEEEHAQHVACWDEIKDLWQSHSKALLIVFNLFALEVCP